MNMNCGVKREWVVRRAAAAHCDVGVGKVGPAEQVHQSVEAGQLTAHQLLSFHHRGVFGSIHVIDGRDHPQT